MAEERDQGMSGPAADTDATAPSPETAEIRTQIEQTRAEMSETIDAIQARLSPSRVAAEAADTFKQATARRVMSIVAGPDLPIALASAAATALIVMVVKRSRASTTGARVSGGHARHVRPLLAAASAGIACWGAWKARQPSREVSGAPSPTWTEIEPLVDEPF